MAWDYLSLTPPAPFDQSDVIALWNFDGSSGQLSDLTGNGTDLTATAGTLANSVVDGFVGWSANEQHYLKSGTATPLQKTGAITIEVLGFLAATSGTRDVWIQCGNSATDSSSVNNTLWQSAVKENTARLQYFHEHGSGTDVLVTANAFFPMGTIQHYVITRSTAHAGLIEVKQYHDSVLILTTSGLTQPSGGSAGYITIGANHDGTERLNGVIFSIRVSSVTFDASHVLDSYNRINT